MSENKYILALLRPILIKKYHKDVPIPVNQHLM